MSHADTIRKGFDAFARGDMDTMNELFADDVIWHTPGHNKWSGTYKGKQDVFRLFGAISAEAELSNEIHTVLADDEHAVALVNASASRHGKTHHHHAVFVFHFRGDQVSETWVINQDQASLDELLN